MNKVFGSEQSPLTEDEYWALISVRLADRFGWDFEYIDNRLTQDDLLRIGGVTEADEKLKPKEKETPLG